MLSRSVCIECACVLGERFYVLYGNVLSGPAVEIVAIELLDESWMQCISVTIVIVS